MGVLPSLVLSARLQAAVGHLADMVADRAPSKRSVKMSVIKSAKLLVADCSAASSAAWSGGLAVPFSVASLKARRSRAPTLRATARAEHPTVDLTPRVRATLPPTDHHRVTIIVEAMASPSTLATRSRPPATEGATLLAQKSADLNTAAVDTARSLAQTRSLAALVALASIMVLSPIGAMTTTMTIVGAIAAGRGRRDLSTDRAVDMDARSMRGIASASVRVAGMAEATVAANRSLLAMDKSPVAMVAVVRNTVPLATVRSLVAMAAAAASTHLEVAMALAVTTTIIVAAMALAEMTMTTVVAMADDKMTMKMRIAAAMAGVVAMMMSLMVVAAGMDRVAVEVTVVAPMVNLAMAAIGTDWLINDGRMTTLWNDADGG